MRRVLVLACALTLVACGAPGIGQSSPPSAKSIAGSDSDYSGMTKCPESGTWDEYLKAEQQSDPATYQTDKADWDQLKASGADDGYVGAYAENSSECAIFSTDSPPKGKVTYVFVIRFKDEGSAEASYKTSAKDFHVSDSDLPDVKAAGGTVTQGSATGLGDNSLEAYVSFAGESIFVGFWQNKRYEVAVLATKTPSGASTTTGRTTTDRIHCMA